MKRFWLIFSQAVTVLLAAYFVLATLQPGWVQELGRRALRSTTGPMNSTLNSTSKSPWNSEAPLGEEEAKVLPDAALGPRPGSLSSAAKIAAPAVVSVTTHETVSALTLHPAVPGLPGIQGMPGLFGPFVEQAPREQNGLGSGVIVSSEGLIVTNHHVVGGADQIKVTLNDGRQTMAKLLGADPETDLAVLKINLKNLPVIQFANAESVQVGDRVLAIGDPFGVGQTVTNGIVSALGRNQLGLNTFENFIQTDAAINPGNSGGALVDVDGHLLGINSAIYSRSGGNMGIGFAIPISTVKQVLNGILKEGRVVRGWIGIEPRELSDGEDNGGQGVLVGGVLADAPAAKAGLKAGDVILKVNQQPVRRVAELLNQVAALSPGQAVIFAIQRNNRILELPVTPDQRPNRPVRR